ELARANAFAAELEYWVRQLERGADEEIPRDGSPETILVRQRERVTIGVGQALTSRLLGEASKAYRTHANELLVVALARALCRWTGRASVAVELEGHGREELGADLDLSRTVGWFTS